MSTTIEPSGKSERGSRKWLTSSQTGQLIGEWQEGPQTLSGYAPRKLRLSFRSRKLKVGTRKFPTSQFALPASDFIGTSAFPLPGPLGRLVQGTALGLSAHKERI